jgi:hypothetical protein
MLISTWTKRANPPGRRLVRGRDAAGGEGCRRAVVAGGADGRCTCGRFACDPFAWGRLACDPFAWGRFACDRFSGYRLAGGRDGETGRPGGSAGEIGRAGLTGA